MPGAFELRETGSPKGLGVFATQPFASKEIIFEEKPLVSAQFCWNEAYGYYACHHCMRPMETVVENFRRLSNNGSAVLPYPELCRTDKSKHTACESCRVGYCSERCKQIAEQQYHHMLCQAKLPGLVRLVECWKQIHFPPETVSIMLIARIIAMIEGSEDKQSVLQTLMSFSHETVSDSGVGLVVDEEKLQLVRQMVAETLPINHAKYLVSEEGFNKLFALIGRNGQGVGTSVFSMWVSDVGKKDMSDEEREAVDHFIDVAYAQMDEHVGTFLNCEGSALFKLQRCLNHSCTPNALVTFPHSDHTAVVQALRPIETGEEICISYIDECTLQRSRHSRNKQLQRYYLFECCCNKCMEQIGLPDETSEEESEEEEEDEEMDS
ncbi:SET and MYND domain-containing protein [Nesidiocoris tenuis]|uniref:SET and MYND domain-containing protein n=1 Tax=Nesidiocoris tenuis TaxID=355587 RepID=A0ABN7BDZ9_9HEMI|nr:SET and MYND domain-containing protein [Nesidiocoris tenuis]